MSLFGTGTVAAGELALTARLDWRSEGEIRQVWFHREFDGQLLPRAPLRIAGDDAAAVFSGVAVSCDAHTEIGLPDWSVTSATRVLERPDANLAIEIECNGTQASCEGEWRVIVATGAFAGFSGSGRTVGHLVDPMPLPWFWNGPALGYTELFGTIITP